MYHFLYSKSIPGKGEIKMKYMLEAKQGRLNLYSPKINSYLMKDASVDQVKIAIATEMEYRTKLEIIKLLITFPHGFLTTNNEIIDNPEAMDQYESWYKEICQRIGFLDEYYDLIDEKIQDIFSKGLNL